MVSHEQPGMNNWALMNCWLFRSIDTRRTFAQCLRSLRNGSCAQPGLWIMKGQHVVLQSSHVVSYLNNNKMHKQQTCMQMCFVCFFNSKRQIIKTSCCCCITFYALYHSQSNWTLRLSLSADRYCLLILTAALWWI